MLRGALVPAWRRHHPHHPANHRGPSARQQQLIDLSAWVLALLFVLYSSSSFSSLQDETGAAARSGPLPPPPAAPVGAADHPQPQQQERPPPPARDNSGGLLMMGTGGGKAQTLVTAAADGAGASVGFLREELGRVGGRAVERYVAVALLPPHEQPQPLPQDQALARLAADRQQQEELRAALLRVLSGSALEAYFFEARPIIIISSSSSMAPPFEFVLVDAPELMASATTYHGGADPRPFSEHLAGSEGSNDVKVFWNLGRDAQLVVPSGPTAPAAEGGASSWLSSMAHLAAFVRGPAPLEQKHLLLQRGAQTVLGQRQQASSSSFPCFWSTSGLGVAWLHMRVEQRPKYYTYQPFKTTSATTSRGTD